MAESIRATSSEHEKVECSSPLGRRLQDHSTTTHCAAVHRRFIAAPHIHSHRTHDDESNETASMERSTYESSKNKNRLNGSVLTILTWEAGIERGVLTIQAGDGCRMAG